MTKVKLTFYEKPFILISIKIYLEKTLVIFHLKISMEKAYVQLFNAIVKHTEPTNRFILLYNYT